MRSQFNKHESGESSARILRCKVTPQLDTNFAVRVTLFATEKSKKSKKSLRYKIYIPTNTDAILPQIP